ncbi:MAG TPA: sigma-54 dependent transcriptional regulator [Bacteroidia bacterium]|jgi:transcriptional regulator with PAS, ATPase and Fis domain|nr:sigma-54 dependent transcriptional regulator [Bacteroidia bacterium]
MTVQEIKNRFRIIGNAVSLDRAIDIARQVAATDLSVLITGESGTGKEVFPQIIHQLSPRKHNQYIAVNCGAIPEGTIDSELFGHEKGSFTGAHDARKGYFEVANGGTIFLDEVAELPLTTQVRLLRVLETGEFIRVGSSKVMKTDVRIVAATNINMLQLIEKGRFREDLYYRLNTVPLHIPPLRERKEDIPLLFRKFATDFADKYKMPPIKLSHDGEDLLLDYYWKGNVRQLKNVTEQISVIEKNREITANILRPYLPDGTSVSVPALFRPEQSGDNNEFTERELLYKVLFEMRKDMVDLKRTVLNLLENEGQNLSRKLPSNSPQIIHKLHQDIDKSEEGPIQIHPISTTSRTINPNIGIDAEEALSLEEREKQYILKALEKHQGNRRAASKELGISERTMYRKIKDYNLE